MWMHFAIESFIALKPNYTSASNNSCNSSDILLIHLSQTTHPMHLPTETQLPLCNVHGSEQHRIIVAVQSHNSAVAPSRVEVRPAAHDEMIRHVNIGHVFPDLDCDIEPCSTGRRAVETLARFSLVVVCDAGFHVPRLIALVRLVQPAR